MNVMQIEQEIREQAAFMGLIELIEFAQEFGVDAFDMSREEIIAACVESEVYAFVS